MPETFRIAGGFFVPDEFNKYLLFIFRYLEFSSQNS